MLTLDSDLGSAYALTVLGIRDREEKETQDDYDYYSDILGLDFDEFLEVLQQLHQEDIISETQAIDLDLALFCYELGRRHEMYKKDMEWLNGNNK